MGYLEHPRQYTVEYHFVFLFFFNVLISYTHSSDEYCMQANVIINSTEKWCKYIRARTRPLTIAFFLAKFTTELFYTLFREATLYALYNRRKFSSPRNDPTRRLNISRPSRLSILCYDECSHNNTILYVGRCYFTLVTIL